MIVSAARGHAETRVALVIGNGGYTAIPSLNNPPNDARDLSAKLKQLGFDVTTGIDLNRDAMERAIAAFAREAAAADVSLFYYGGHGVQVATHDFLLPVDFEMNSDFDVYSRSVALDKVLNLQRGAGVHLVFLDACRTNPLRGAPADQRMEGLAPVGKGAGFLIAFATQPDGVTFDGRERNSPFVASLLSHIGTSGESASSMMIEVRRDVIAITEGAQIPWENSSLTRQFYFAPGNKSDDEAERPRWRLLPLDFESAGAASQGKKWPEGSTDHEDAHGWSRQDLERISIARGLRLGSAGHATSRPSPARDGD